MDLYKLIKGIEALNKDTIPNWGKMNSSMMLMHCSRFIDVYLGKVPFNPIMFLFGYTFSIFHIYYLKYIVRYEDYIYIRKLPTLRFINTFKYNELDFDKEKDYLINSLKIVDEYEKDYIVNNFHGRVRNKTFKQVVNFHTSYHLNQFGVL